jgi:ubiquinone/menaquinone biosynthesis C-methylase UbiE
MVAPSPRGQTCPPFRKARRWFNFVSYRAKLLFFVLGALAALFILNIGYSALETLARLNAVEAEREHWQRPSDVIQALNLKRGDVVVDLGCGSGYFTLKLSSEVGDNGRIIAEDIRRLPLAFLWFRAAQRSEHNVRILLGEPSDPHLPSRVNAVLISNTYHEFTDSRPILVHIHQSLVSDGRLVVVDRQPKQANAAGSETEEHEISADRVENELRRANFEIVNRQDPFIQKDSYGETWWLIVAREP